MTALTFDDLTDLDPVFVEAEDPSLGLPVGEYLFCITAHRAEMSKSQKRMAVTELKVVGGEHDGEKTTLYNVIEDAQQIGRYKAMLGKMGIDCNQPGFSLAQFLGGGGNAVLINRVVKGTRTEGNKPGADGSIPRFTNILGVATAAEIAAATGAAAPAGAVGSAPASPAAAPANPFKAA